jgi:hypothetical protein
MSVPELGKATLQISLIAAEIEHPPPGGPRAIQQMRQQIYPGDPVLAPHARAQQSREHHYRHPVDTNQGARVLMQGTKRGIGMEDVNAVKIHAGDGHWLASQHGEFHTVEQREIGDSRNLQTGDEAVPTKWSHLASIQLG